MAAEGTSMNNMQGTKYAGSRIYRVYKKRQTIHKITQESGQIQENPQNPTETGGGLRETMGAGGGGCGREGTGSGGEK